MERTLSERIESRVPEGTNGAVVAAAKRAGVDKSEWLRCAIRSALGDETVADKLKVNVLPAPIPVPTSAFEASDLLARVAVATATGELDRGVARDVTGALRGFLAGEPSRQKEQAILDLCAMFVVHRETWSRLSPQKHARIFTSHWKSFGGVGPVPQAGDFARCPCPSCDHAAPEAVEVG